MRLKAKSDMMGSPPDLCPSIGGTLRSSSSSPPSTALESSSWAAARSKRRRRATATWADMRIFFMTREAAALSHRVGSSTCASFFFSHSCGRKDNPTNATSTQVIFLWKVSTAAVPPFPVSFHSMYTVLSIQAGEGGGGGGERGSWDATTPTLREKRDRREKGCLSLLGRPPHTLSLSLHRSLRKPPPSLCSLVQYFSLTFFSHYLKALRPSLPPSLRVPIPPHQVPNPTLQKKILVHNAGEDARSITFWGPVFVVN